jgi:N-acetylneuraminic acid mutarotase
VIRLDHAFARFIFGDQVGRVDLSLDGGASWRNLLQLDDEFFDHRVEEIPIPEAAGVAGVQVRFHYTNSRNGFWWQLDNVLVGSEVTCDPIEGGLVAGHVRDRNTGSGVVGATVRSGSEVVVESLATPDDPALEDGFYWLFLPGGEHELAASAHRYTSHTEPVDVVPSSVAWTDLRLPAGRLTVAPASVSADVQIGQSVERSFTVTNTGTAPAELDLRERGAAAEVAEGGGAALQRLHGPVTDLSVVHAPPAGAEDAATGADEAPWQGIADYPFRVLDNLADTWDGRVYSVSGVDAAGWRHETMRYDPGSGEWTELAPIPTAREKPNGAIIGGKFYVVGGWDTDGDTPVASLEIYDIASDTWTAGAPIPVARAASGSAVLDGKLYLVGGCQASCGSTEVWVYDPSSDEWASVAPYPQPASWTHCGAIDGLLYCAGGSRGPTAASYVYDPALDTWRPVAPMPQPQWGGAYAVANGRLIVSGGVIGGQVTNQGYAYDPLAGAWEPIPNANQARYRGAGACGFYRIGGSTGGLTPAAESESLPGFDDCLGDVDVPWLSVSPGAAVLAPGESVTVTAVLDADVEQPGDFDARIAVTDDTPYRTAAVPVALDVSPANNWGRITGTVTGISCDGEQVVLAGADVHIDGRLRDATVTTDGEGRYAYWSPVQNNRLTLTISHAGYQSATRRTIALPLHDVTEDITLMC